MVRTNLVCMVLMFAGLSFLLAQDEGKLKSGPKVGASMPGSFECVIVTKHDQKDDEKDKKKDNRRYCLVCKFGLNPSVLILAKEPAAGKDQAFTDLMKQLDDLVGEFAESSFSTGVVIVSPDARDSTNNPQAGSVKDLTQDVEKDSEEAVQRIREQAKKLNDEEVNRANLLKRLTKRTEGLKHVIVGFVPVVPKNYEINPKAELTVIFYERMKVIETYSYSPGAFDAKDVKTIVDRVREELLQKKKVVEENKDK
jgi:hypothetical protein